MYGSIITKVVLRQQNSSKTLLTMVPMSVSCCDRESSARYEANCCSPSDMNLLITSWIWSGNESLSACS